MNDIESILAGQLMFRRMQTKGSSHGDDMTSVNRLAMNTNTTGPSDVDMDQLAEAVQGSFKPDEAPFPFRPDFLQEPKQLNMTNHVLSKSTIGPRRTAPGPQGVRGRQGTKHRTAKPNPVLQAHSEVEEDDGVDELARMMELAFEEELDEEELIKRMKATALMSPEDILEDSWKLFDEAMQGDKSLAPKAEPKMAENMTRKRGRSVSDEMKAMTLNPPPNPERWVPLGPNIMLLVSMRHQLRKFEIGHGFMMRVKDCMTVGDLVSKLHDKYDEQLARYGLSIADIKAFELSIQDGNSQKVAISGARHVDLPPGWQDKFHWEGMLDQLRKAAAASKACNERVSVKMNKYGKMKKTKESGPSVTFANLCFFF